MGHRLGIQEVSMLTFDRIFFSESVTSEGKRRRRRHRKYRRRGGGNEAHDGDGWGTSADEGWSTSANEGWAGDDNWNASCENWDTQSASGWATKERTPAADYGGRRGRGRGQPDGPPSREGTMPSRRPPRHEGTPARQSPGRRPPPQPRKPQPSAVNGN